MEQAAEQKLKSIVARVLQVDAATINEGASPATIASWDSLTHMQLVFALEEEYGVTLTEHQIADMTVYPRIVAIIDGMNQ